MQIYVKSKKNKGNKQNTSKNKNKHKNIMKKSKKIKHIYKNKKSLRNRRRLKTRKYNGGSKSILDNFLNCLKNPVTDPYDKVLDSKAILKPKPRSTNPSVRIYPESVTNNPLNENTTKKIDK
jgi:hypothetical protein